MFPSKITTLWSVLDKKRTESGFLLYWEDFIL